MPIKVIKAEDRLKQKPKINTLILGPSGVGKTTLIRTLPPKKTIVCDIEAGSLALAGWEGDVIDIKKQAQAIGMHPWEMCRALACVIGGPEPLTMEDDPYGEVMHQAYVENVITLDDLKQYENVAVDSITDACRCCWHWAEQQADSFTKDGVKNKLGTYGLVGMEMVRWLKHLQAYGDKTLFVIGILEQKIDKFERASWVPQLIGDTAKRELAGIFDQIVTLAMISDGEGGTYRALIPKFDNEYGFPAKDRSGCLDDLEPPDLDAFMKKIRAGKRLDTEVVKTMPATAK